jgi:hypothetical protein
MCSMTAGTARERTSASKNPYVFVLLLVGPSAAAAWRSLGPSLCEVWGRSGCWLHAVPVRDPSPRIKACTHATVHVEGVSGAAKQRFRACESSRQVATAAYDSPLGSRP